jgi:hypothetical protein
MRPWFGSAPDPIVDTCDMCGKPCTEGEWVEVRIPRPSDPTDMTCIMAGCKACFPDGKSPKAWQEWIEGPGFLWLT